VSVAAQNLVAMVTPVPEHGARSQELLSNYVRRRDGALVVTLATSTRKRTNCWAFEVAMHAQTASAPPSAVHYAMSTKPVG